MPTIGQVASLSSTGLGVALPLLTSLSNPVSAAIAGAVGLVALVDKIGQGRKAANKMTGTGGPQDILNKQLAAISSSQSSAEEKSSATDKAWRDFLGAANQFAAANPKQAKVVQQAIYQTPQLTSTVQNLLGRDPLAGDYTSIAAPGMSQGQTMPNPGPSVAGTLARTGLNVGLPFLMNQIQGRKIGDISTSPGVPEWNPETGQWETSASTPTFGTNVPRGTSAGAGARTGDGAPQSLLQRLLPQLISGGTSVLGGIIASRAAGRAANVQAGAAERAAELQSQAARDALQFNREALTQQQQNLQPWISAGGGALRSIQDIVAQPFAMPTPEEAMGDPGIQFQLQQGQRALEQYQRRRGISLSGKAIKDIETFSQGVASTGYQDVVNRRLQERQANLNPLFSLAGLGQDTTQSLVSQIGASGARAGDIGMTGAARAGEFGTQAAMARASGYGAQGNIWGGTFGQIGQNVLDQYTLNQILQRVPINSMVR